jgi:DNA polymerase III alpha subunit (gram-positive type)
MNINDLDNKEYSHFKDHLSKFVDIKENPSKILFAINTDNLWTEDDDKKYVENIINNNGNEKIIEKFHKMKGKTNEEEIITQIYNLPNDIFGYNKEIQLPINIKANVDFYYKNKIIKVKYVKEINFLHLLQGILLSLMTTNEFELWNFMDNTVYNYSFIITDKFELLNTLCDLLSIKHIKFNYLTILYDLETTGLNTNTDKVVQIYAEETLFESVIVNTLVNPEMKIPEVVINIHHITDEMVKNQPTIEKVKKMLDYKLRNVNKKEIWAHNGNWFDHKISRRYQLFGDNILESDSKIALGKLVNNNYNAIRRSLALQSLYNDYLAEDDKRDGKIINFHNAKTDVDVMKRLLKKFKFI